MALSGLHISCVVAGGQSTNGPLGLLPVYSGNPVWSELLTSAGTSTNYSTKLNQIFRIYASNDSYVSIAPSPGTPSSTNGFFVKALETIDVVAPIGSYVAWVNA